MSIDDRIATRILQSVAGRLSPAPCRAPYDLLSRRNRVAAGPFIAVERPGGARDERLHSAFGPRREFERDVAPDLAAASKHRLSIEQPIALGAGNGEPPGTSGKIDDLLAIGEGDRLHVGRDRLVLDRGCVEGEPGGAVGRYEALAAPIRFWWLQLPARRHGCGRVAVGVPRPRAGATRSRSWRIAFRHPRRHGGRAVRLHDVVIRAVVMAMPTPTRVGRGHHQG